MGLSIGRVFSPGFTLRVSDADGQRQRRLFDGVSGPLLTCFPPGGTGFLCVKLPVQRMAVVSSGGASFQCDGGSPGGSILSRGLQFATLP